MSASPSETNDTYENRIVAFVDILGFKDLVVNRKVSIILKAMMIIRKRLNLIDGVAQSPINKSQFSDSIILSCPNDHNGTIHLLHFTSLLASEFFLNGVLCRGAIASGEMLHNGDVAFGPALIVAIEMERQLAIYPRILVTEDVADGFVDAKNAVRSPRRQLGAGAYFRRDFDHLLHLDIFSPTMFVPPETGTIKEAVQPVHRQVLNRIDAEQSIESMKIRAKLFWLSTYLEYVDEFHGNTHFNIRDS